MRVIAGQYRSRVLQAPPGTATRPTSDRLRETLFNILAPRLAEAAFWDLYAGSGAVGIEAMSRGAADVTFVEKASPAVVALRRNLAALGIAGGTRIREEAVAKFLAKSAGQCMGADIVFLDPPYESEAEYAHTLQTLANHSATLLRPGGLVVAEHRRKLPLQENYGCLRRTRVVEQGDAALSFFADNAV